MSMKSRMTLLSVFAGMAAMGGGSFDLPGERKTLPSKEYKPKEPILRSYKHIGEIPKGCKLETEIIQVEKDVYLFSVEVDLVFGTIKARKKKCIKYCAEIEEFFKSCDIDYIIKCNPNLTYTNRELLP